MFWMKCVTATVALALGLGLISSFCVPTSMSAWMFRMPVCELEHCEKDLGWIQSREEVICCEFEVGNSGSADLVLVPDVEGRPEAALVSFYPLTVPAGKKGVLTFEIRRNKLNSKFCLQLPYIANDKRQSNPTFVIRGKCPMPSSVRDSVDHNQAVAAID